MISNTLKLIFLCLIISLVTSDKVTPDVEAIVTVAASGDEYSENYGSDLLEITQKFIAGLSQVSPILLGLLILSALIGLTPILMFFSILIVFNYTVLQWYLYQSGFLEVNPNYFWHIISIYLYSLTILFV